MHFIAQVKRLRLGEMKYWPSTPHHLGQPSKSNVLPRHVTALPVNSDVLVRPQVSKLLQLTWTVGIRGLQSQVLPGFCGPLWGPPQPGGILPSC